MIKAAVFLALLLLGETARADTCPSMPPVESADVITEIQGKLSTLMKLGSGEFSTKIQLIPHDLLTKFPSADKLYLSTVMLSMTCHTLQNSPNIDASERVKIQSEVFKEVMQLFGVTQPVLSEQKKTSAPRHVEKLAEFRLGAIANKGGTRNGELAMYDAGGAFSAASGVMNSAVTLEVSKAPCRNGPLRATELFNLGMVNSESTYPSKIAYKFSPIRQFYFVQRTIEKFNSSDLSKNYCIEAVVWFDLYFNYLDKNDTEHKLHYIIQYPSFDPRDFPNIRKVSSDEFDMYTHGFRMAPKLDWLDESDGASADQIKNLMRLDMEIVDNQKNE